MDRIGKVPFSWENKPGISKQSFNNDGDGDDDDDNYKQLSLPLPLPPCPTGSGRRLVTTEGLHDIQIPLPPCAFQPPPSRSSSRKGLGMMNMKHADHDRDPFLVAFKECTKTSTRSGAGELLAKTKHKGMFGFSCKRSCSVRDDNLVRVSQLPAYKKKGGDM